MDAQNQLIEKQKEEIVTVNKNWLDDVKKNNKQKRQLTAQSVKGCQSFMVSRGQKREIIRTITSEKLQNLVRAISELSESPDSVAFNHSRIGD